MGGAVSEQKIEVTFFPNWFAGTQYRRAVTPTELGSEILEASAAVKEELQWLKLARFGNKKTAKGSLRSDSNLIAITGIEIDLDRETLEFEEVVDILEKAGLAAVVYTSPSHKLNGHGPRLRVLLPTSKEYPPKARDHFIARAAGLFRSSDNETLVSGESWTRSQSYYYGSVGRNPEHRVKILEGEYIDLADELDEIALGKPATKARAGKDAESPWLRDTDEEALCQMIVSGANYHQAAMRLLGFWNDHDVPLGEAKRRLEELFKAVEETKRDDRWRARRDSIPEMLAFIWVKEADRRDAREAGFDDFLNRAPPPGADADEEPQSFYEPPHEESWPEMADEAFIGLAGDIVRAIAPLSEADPVAILAQTLAAFGCAMGRGPHYLVGPTRHHAALYAMIVGDTSKGRKGTSWDPIREIFKLADSNWAEKCIKAGLVSGEGVIHAIHDGVWVSEKSKKSGQYERVMKENPVEDKRLLILEPELAIVLAALKRQGNTLSPVLRNAWDGEKLQTLGKHHGETATAPHLSILAHVTVEELRAELDRVSMSNGFANRFCIFLVRRSQFLPFPTWPEAEVVKGLADRLAAILSPVSKIGLRRQITWHPEAREMWIAGYHELSAAKPGLFGSLIARSEAQVIRLAMIYALLGSGYTIEPRHLRAALAVWNYVEASTRYVFGDALGDPVADELYRALRRAGADGMTRSEISNYFGRNQTSDRIGEALRVLSAAGKIRRRMRQGPSGRPTEIWIA
jgi:hypothetical protein